MNNATGQRSPSWMYDFNWANTRLPSISQVESVTHYIIEANLTQKALEIVRFIMDACGDLGYNVWQCNALKLMQGLKNIDINGNKNPVEMDIFRK